MTDILNEGVQTGIFFSPCRDGNGFPEDIVSGKALLLWPAHCLEMSLVMTAISVTLRVCLYS
jgi:hypothetical protein